MARFTFGRAREPASSLGAWFWTKDRGDIEVRAA